LFAPSQAAVVGAATVLMASPAFAATIKLGGDNGELGFFVSDPSRRSRFRRARVRPSAIAAASQSPMPTRADPRLRCDTSASGRRASSRASQVQSRFFAETENRKQKLTSFTTLSFSAQPNKITVAKGETIEFVNNKAFPHNVVFDEDNVPSGVNADAISHEDYLNGPGEKVTNKFDTPGTYGYYCEPHQGAGMQGTIIVQ
jgi:plastocyanin